jgi:hypothetical protein
MINKWAGERGGKEYARNKKEDGSRQIYKLFPVKFSMGFKQVQVKEV